MAYIIAEIGFNHEGDSQVAAEMIRAAADAGAHAVKFQSFRAGDIALPTSPHFEAIKEGEVTEEQHVYFSAVARDHGVDFLSTPFGPWAVELLERLDVPAYKVASMDCTNRFLLRQIAQTGKAIYLSSGMASLDELAETLSFLQAEKSGPVTLLHCLSLYPAESKDLNLETIPFLKSVFQLPVGYSDHHPGTDACLAAAMLGAEVIETHFTLDSAKEGGDHFHSVEPDALKELVSKITLFDIMRGQRQTIFQRPDRQFAKDYRRGVHAARKIEKGRPITMDDLQLCRPATSFSPNDLDQIIGKTALEEIAAGTALDGGLLQPVKIGETGE